ncbi:HsdM family class I SAM-dependent methyltransferase [Melittangium boletus]|uniref:DNA methylase adenine-specific domain-containing protein n=1 Tax=Melittangium boletus DSM 14713 TaxID=1294270 RepID=A0A250I904_9BACT|nr:N-6 DNA methylase [Melittangium boletus]ATB27446.1 hypothetical protein MEBOL_000888 [Melittangium boletus DSM 14713]
MAGESPVAPERLAMLLSRLGYTPESGWLDAHKFDALSAHRFAMQQARQEMSVIGAFCLRRLVDAMDAIATPLVYVATASDLTAAKEVHRRVWSQGLVPFLLVATPDEVLLCQGFSYSDSQWELKVKHFEWQVVSTLPRDPVATVELTEEASVLWDLRAIRLRTSLFWHDHVIDVEGRVDRRLLKNLDTLSDVLINGLKVSRKLLPPAANGLIGRLLYVFFLADRGIINQKWVVARKHKGIDLENQAVNWSARSTWKFLDDLDSIFNGSIFPLSETERAEIDESHINLVRRVMKYGAVPFRSGAVQFSFLDFYLGALRTETLSSVYEQFLKNIRSGERRRSGAFYTPPFLVDFMLDRVEERKPLRDGVTVLDPAAGSGVFLVGAYRRIIERARAERPDQPMSLDEVRELLVRNIFGVERNADACHVAAFSLYLMMLDYVDPRDLTRVAAGEDPKKLFPGLVGSNLFALDFFKDRNAFPGLPERVDCIVGNPPWQTLTILESEAAEEWHDKHKSAPIGKNQAAELFTWKALREHLSAGGILGFLLPAKSFINPTSWEFRRKLAREFTIVGSANFAHLRYRLFANARQAVVATFIQGRAPKVSDRTWVYSPLSIGQPMARKEWPWTILLDRAEVQMFSHSHIAGDQRGWFDAFILRPVDRQIRNYLEDAAAKGDISLLSQLCDSVGAAIRRGGNSTETGVARAYLNDAPSEPVPAIELLRYHGGGLFGDQSTYRDTELPRDRLARVKKPYRFRFSGNVMLVPRNFSNIRFVKHPIAYTSSTLAVFFKKPADEVNESEKRLLQAIARYLRSQTALYLVAITGRRWLMDRRNIEPADLSTFPVPFTGLEDPRVGGALECDDHEFESFLRDALGLSGDLERAIKEFLEFRIEFQDGNVPENALNYPSRKEIAKYAAVLRRSLDGQLGRAGAFEVACNLDSRAGVGVIAAQFRDIGAEKGPGNGVDALCRAALARYLRSASNSFTDSLSATYDNKTASVSVIKPLETFRWTIDSAFADSRQMMNAFVAGQS